MDQLLPLLPSLLDASSEEGISGFLRQRPELIDGLLEEETVYNIISLMQTAQQQGAPQAAELLKRLAVMLITVAQISGREWALTTGPKPAEREPQDSWPRLARAYLARLKPELLEAAIDAARRDGEAEAAALLLHFRRKDFEQLFQLAEKMFGALRAAGREEEALTVALLGLDPRASMAGNFMYYPVEQQAEALRIGLEASRQAAHFAGSIGDEECQAFYLMSLGNGWTEARHFAEAESAYEEALSKYRALAAVDIRTYANDVARVLNNLGTVRHAAGHVVEAEAAFEESLRMWRELSSAEPGLYEHEVARTLNNLGNLRRDLRRLAEAEAAFREALLEYENLDERRRHRYESEAARALINLGNVLVNLRRLEEAEAAYGESLRRYRVLNEGRPRAFEADIAMTLNNLASVRQTLGKLEEAEEVYKESLASYRELAEGHWQSYAPRVADVLDGLGSVRRDMRKLEEAESALEESLVIRRRLAAAEPQAYDAHIASALNNLGNVLRDLRRTAEAETALEEALSKYRSLASSNPQAHLHNVAMALINLGSVRRDLNKTSEAEAAFEESLALYRRLAADQPRVFESEVATALNGLGAARHEAGKTDEAEACYAEALAIYRELSGRRSGYDRQICWALTNLGNLCRTGEKTKKAQAWYGEALEISRRQGLPVERSIASFALGEYAVVGRSWEEAEQLLREAVGQVEGLRTEAQNLSRRGQVLREYVHVYERLMFCLLRQGKNDEALAVAEQGRSRTINDLLASREFRPRDEKLARARDSLLVRARALEDRERYLRERLSAGRTDGEQESDVLRQLGAVRRERIEAGSELEELGRTIGRAEPDFLPYARSLSADEIKQVAVEARAALLLFRVTEFGSFVFIVFPDGEMDVVEIPDFRAEDFEQMLVESEGGEPVGGWSVLYYRRQRGAWLDFMVDALKRLYRDLLEPVRTRLRERSEHMNGSKRLVIVPNRGLAILPLHACLWEEGGRAIYLSDEYVCAYAPSVYILKRSLSRRRRLEKQDSLLGLFNPDGDDPARRLAFSEWECDEIERLFGGRCSMRRGGAATKESLFSESSKHQLLHFSCHGKYELDAPLQSSLVLSREGLSLGEVMARMDLRHTWLTVLSACETSLGDFREIADEQYGLPLGFMAAGTPTVWGALWSVSDQSTALLMMKAYEALSAEDGADKPEALRLAQLWLRDVTREELLPLIEKRLSESEGDTGEWERLVAFRRYVKTRERPFAHPYFWAGMQCVGL